MTKLAAGRASMMPSISPLITLPTMRPRIASGARWEAYGTSTWAATEPRPTPRAASRNGAAWPDNPAAARARALIPTAASTRARFSNTSASGTTSSSPAP